MDTDQLIAHGRARFEHAAARRLLREKYQAKLLLACQGGMFKVTPEMIAFLTLYDSQDIVLEDLYGSPIKVNARQLCDEMKLRWQEQMTAWWLEHERLQSTR